MEHIKKIIVDEIKKRGSMTFVELESLLTLNNYNWKGTNGWSDNKYNIIYWHGWNKEAFDIIIELKAKEKIFMHPCPLFVYLIDGKVPNLPRAKLDKAKVYKKPHWLPVIFSCVAL